MIFRGQNRSLWNRYVFSLLLKLIYDKVKKKKKYGEVIIIYILKNLIFPKPPKKFVVIKSFWKKISLIAFMYLGNIIYSYITYLLILIYSGYNDDDTLKLSLRFIFLCLLSYSTFSLNHIKKVELLKTKYYLSCSFIEHKTWCTKTWASLIEFMMA